MKNASGFNRVKLLRTHISCQTTDHANYQSQAPCCAYLIVFLKYITAANADLKQHAEPEDSPPPTRRRHSPSPSGTSSNDEGVDGEADGDTQEGGSHDQMVKKLVRLALASEYSRQPIRRTDITAKGALFHSEFSANNSQADAAPVMAPNSGRQFKHVFSEAQNQLRSVFGMEMTELPQKDKVTISQKRTAARSGVTSSTTSKAYILTSTLPPRFRKPNILPPAQIPSPASEAAYVGLTTFILALVYLSPSSSISEPRLEKHLKRMNADNYVLHGEKTEKVLKRMEREQYIVKVRERDGGGEETVDYVVGPRGKVEVGERGIAGLVKRVYNKKDAETDELERRLVRSLGDVVIEKKGTVNNEQAEDVEQEPEPEPEQSTRRNGRRGSKKQTRRSSGRTRRTRDREEEEAEEEEEEEGDDAEEEEEDDDEDIDEE